MLTLYGKFQMGFRDANGGEVHFDVTDEVPNTVNVIRPEAKVVEPTGESVDVGVINAAGHLYNGRNYIDVEFSTPAGTALDLASILDTDAEFTLMVNGVPVTVDGVPIPMVSSINASGNLEVQPLIRTPVRRWSRRSPAPAPEDSDISSAHRATTSRSARRR